MSLEIDEEIALPDPEEAGETPARQPEHDVAPTPEEMAAEEHHRAYREAGSLALDHIKNVHRVLLGFKGDARFAIKCCAAAHGFWTLLDERDQVQIAEHFGCTKANVNKLVGIIQKRLGLPEMFGQRRAEGRANMRKARCNQLKPANQRKET